jgi:tetratricopeptide (TPR) repeat protein
MMAKMSLKPKVFFTNTPKVGQRYLMTIDFEAFGEWAFNDDEELVIRCILNTRPLFDHEAIGGGTVILHRFGGSYGQAQFVLTASNRPQVGSITITMVNQYSGTMDYLVLPDIHILSGEETQKEIVNVMLLPSKEEETELQTSVSIHPPSPDVAREQANRALLLAQAEAQSAARQPYKAARIINNLPRRYDSATPFYDRAREQASIQDAIQRGARLITIHARAGAGKTALACKVLGDLEVRSDLVTGIVSLTAGELQKRVTIDRILSDFKRLLPEGAFTYEPGDTASDKTVALLDALREGRYVLLLDSLELLLDEDYTLPDADLQAFLTTVLERGGLTILVTTRQLLRLPKVLRVYEQLISLDSGLPTDEALAMLRRLDYSNKLPADETLLRELIMRVNGFPRALEAAIGFLAGSPTLTLEELLQDNALFEGEVTQHIVEKALSTLTPLLMHVMEALALLGQPTSLAAIEYMLAPYVNWSGTTLRDVLNQLIERSFVNYNPATQRFSLHPLDREYCENRIPLGTPQDVDIEPPPYTRYTLNARAAHFFESQRKPKKEWKTLSDLEPELSEFEYRIRLSDYDGAASLLFDFDYDYLLLWGHVRLMLTLHERLLGNIKDRRLQGVNLGRLAVAYHNLGEIHRAIDYYEQALTIDREIGGRESEGIALGNLGLAYSDLGELHKAIDYYEQALGIAYEVGSKHPESINLGNLGLAYHDLGEGRKAIEYYEQALAITREIGDKRGEGTQLGNLGLAYHDLGEGRKAIEYYEQALAITREIGDKRGEGAQLGNIGRVLLEAKDYKSSITMLSQSLTIADEIQDPRMRNIMGESIARAHLLQGNVVAALQAIEMARPYSNDYNAAALHGVIQMKIGNTEAARLAFDEVLKFTNALINQPQSAYSVRYARALARAGLALVTNGSLDSAQSDYEAALAQVATQGVVQDNLHLLEQLALTPHGDRLEPLLAMMRERL